MQRRWSVIPGFGRVLGVLARAGFWLGLGAAAAGCGGGAAKPAETPRLPGEHRDTRVIHEPCDTSSSGAVARDLDGDGRPDSISVRVGGAERCRALDLDFDGVLDVWVYFEPGGAVRRRETDFDRDGQIDEISLYRAGQLSERQQVSGPRRAIDTWHHYDGGKLLRTLRDSVGDGRIDQWWEYPAATNAGCALVHSDVDGDGRPDPGATVDLCKEGSMRLIEAAEGAGAPPAAGRPQPVEVAAPPAPAAATVNEGDSP